MAGGRGETSGEPLPTTLVGVVQNEQHMRGECVCGGWQL